MSKIDPSVKELLHSYITQVLDDLEAQQDSYHFRLVKIGRTNSINPAFILIFYLPPEVRWTNVDGKKFSLPFPHRYVTIVVSPNLNGSVICGIQRVSYHLHEEENLTDFKWRMGSFLPNSSAGDSFCLSMSMSVRSKEGYSPEDTPDTLTEAIERLFTAFYNSRYNADYAEEIPWRVSSRMLADLYAKGYTRSLFRGAALDSFLENGDKFWKQYYTLLEWMEKNPDLWSESLDKKYRKHANNSPGDNLYASYVMTDGIPYSDIAAARLDFDRLLKGVSGQSVKDRFIRPRIMSHDDLLAAIEYTRRRTYYND
jgi:hypothetical protein